MFFRNLKIKLAVFGVMAVVGAGAIALDRHDLSTNYTQVKAEITSVEVDCFVKNGRRRLVDKRTDELAYMNCDFASFAAQQHGYKNKDITKRAKVKYDYVSPVDGDYYSGEFTRTGNVDGYAAGREISVYAHKKKPEKSRMKGNI